MKINDFPILNFGTPYVIAEIGSNHNGDIELAKKLIDAAKETGCNCVKFQSWTAETIFSNKVYQDNYFLADDYRNRSDHSLRSIVEKYSLSEMELEKLANYCHQIGIDFSSTPFSKKEVDFLVDHLDVPFIKIASMDLNNYPFLEYVAKKSKIIILSTGLSKLWEVDKAIEVIENTSGSEIILLHCVSVYPPKDDDINLNNIDMLRANYSRYPVGFSDHSIGFEIPLAAIAKGACIIEKHFTLDKDAEGWDHKVSATPNEMRVITNAGQRISKALGSYRRKLSQDEKIKIESFRRSIVAKNMIKAGQVISRDDLDIKRPGTGISPEYIDFIVGRVATNDIAADQIIEMRDF